MYAAAYTKRTTIKQSKIQNQVKEITTCNAGNAVSFVRWYMDSFVPFESAHIRIIIYIPFVKVLTIELSYMLLYTLKMTILTTLLMVHNTSACAFRKKFSLNILLSL